MVQLHRRRDLCKLLLAAAAVVLAPIEASADRFWVGGETGNWNNPANWSTTLGGPGGAGVPTANELV